MPQTLREMREAAGLTQAQVAATMNTNRSRVGHIESRYPNVRYQTLLSYIAALGGDVVFTGIAGSDVPASHLVVDPTKEATRRYLEEKSSKAGQMRINAEIASAKELPLQSNQPDPGSDDPGGQIDQPDPERDEDDRGNGQQT